jgi:lipid-binding SYLF domain-containing protein
MRKLTILMVLVALTLGVGWAEETRVKELDRVNAAAKVLNQVMAAPDKGIPEEILSAADCVAIVPSMLKGGFVFGANYGKGVATCRTARGWSAPAPFRIEGGSWGLQIGGEAVDLIMLVMNQQGLENLLSSKFKIGADASAAAGPIGRHVEGETDWKMRAQVLTYSRARGAFAGITLNGAVVKQDTDDTIALYGKEVTFRSLLSGQVPPPAGTRPFIAEVAKYFRAAKAGERAENRQNPAPAAPARTTSNDGSNTAASGGFSGTATMPSQSAPATAAPAGGNIGASAESNGRTATSSMTTESTSSADVQQQIQKALRNAPGLSTTNINVNVTDQTVELSGSVPTQSDKASAHRIAEQNAGNRRVVDDNLVVK